MEKLTGNPEFSVEIEKVSSILRKMTVKVPALVVKKHFDRGLASVQKTANLKGFRPGYAPLTIIKQQFGDDVRHRVFHNLIDETFENAVREHSLKTIGSPKIDTPDHKTGEGSHDHKLSEDQDLTFIATFEILPEIEVKGYTGISVSQDQVDVTPEDVKKVVDSLHQSQAQLISVAGGLVLSDGTQNARSVVKGDFVDTKFSGGLVIESVVHSRDDMSGNRVIEVGSGGWIPGFEEQVIGMKAGETKTFRVTFPQDEAQGEFAGKEAEFTATVNEIKEKKLPVLDDELAKQLGYENLENLHSQARTYLVREKTEDSDRKVKSDLLAQLIEKNPFEIPASLIEGQTRALVQDLAQEFKKQGYDNQTIQNAITQDVEQLKKRAENQVRASLVLESVAHQENIQVSKEDLEGEVARTAVAMNVDKAKIEEYYAKNPGKMGDLEFRLRQERTLRFLLDKAKVKSVPASEK